MPENDERDQGEEDRTDLKVFKTARIHYGTCRETSAEDQGRRTLGWKLPSFPVRATGFAFSLVPHTFYDNN